MIERNRLLKALKDITNDNNIIRRVMNINDLKVQGSRNVAIESLEIVKEFYKKEGYGKKLTELIDLLMNIRYTQSITYNVMHIVKKHIKEKGLAIIDELLKTIMDAPKNISKNFLKEILEFGYKDLTIMLHCHSSETTHSIISASKNGINIKAYVTETRPKMQGIITAKELLSNGIDVTYIVDSAAGYYMKYVDLFVSGIDSIREEGIVNKIGTYMMALAAKDNKKSVWFVGDYLKLDNRKDPYIEMRDPREIIDPNELKGAKILNPAFDITPWKLIDKVITDRGVIYKNSNNSVLSYMQRNLPTQPFIM